MAIAELLLIAACGATAGAQQPAPSDELKALLVASRERFATTPKPRWTDAERADATAKLAKLLEAAKRAHAVELAAAKVELAKAKAAYDADPQSGLAAYAAAVHAYNWRITSDQTIGPVTDIYAALRDWQVIFDYDRNRPAKEVTPEFRRWAFEGYRWVDEQVFAQMATHPQPLAEIDRAYLKKPKIKLAICGDSITEYMDPARTLLEYLDERFEVLDCGLAGHAIGTWFTNTAASDAVRKWDADVIVMMLGTNGTTGAMRTGAGKGNRDAALKQYGVDLVSLRNLPSSPQVLLSSVPPVGPGLWYAGVPAMWELQAHVAHEHQLPFNDFHSAIHGLLSDVPTPNLGAVQGRAARKWFHSTDDAHTNTGPAMAKYYGLVCRQILDPSEWHELHLECDVIESPQWKDAWLLAQCHRSPAPADAQIAVGIQQRRIDSGDPKHPDYVYEPIAGVQASNKANGEVSFLRAGGAKFYLLPRREQTLTFGRPYQIADDDPPTDDSLPEHYTVGGRVVRGDGQGVAHLAIALTQPDGKTLSAKTDAEGRFALDKLTGNPAQISVTIEAIPTP